MKERKNMKIINYEKAMKLISNYIERLSHEKKLNPKEDKFTVLLPLEDRQGVLFDVSVDDSGERKVSINISDNIIVMKKAKNTVLNVFDNGAE